MPASPIVLNYCGNTKYFEDMYSQRHVLLYYLSLGWGKRQLATTSSITNSQNELLLTHVKSQASHYCFHGLSCIPFLAVLA